MNKVQVTICKKKYNITTDNEVSFVEELAEKLDREIRALADRYPSLGIQSSAVFCALAAYEEKAKAVEETESLRTQLRKALAEVGKMRDARDNAVIEADRLREKYESSDSDDDADASDDDYSNSDQIIFENTITPSITLPVDVEKEAPKKRMNRAQRRKLMQEANEQIAAQEQG